MFIHIINNLKNIYRYNKTKKLTKNELNDFLGLNMLPLGLTNILFDESLSFESTFVFTDESSLGGQKLLDFLAAHPGRFRTSLDKLSMPAGS